MTTITIPLSDTDLAGLRARAEQRNLTPEELVRRVVEEILKTPDDQFQRAAEHVLRKNAELYKRLA